jgi:hypothetical protein
MKASLDKLLGSLALAAALSPLFALYGAWTALLFLLGLPSRLRRLLAALAPTVACPQGHPNPTVGRFGCACGAAYQGWIGRCPVCGAGARTTTCDACELTVVLPWEKP